METRRKFFKKAGLGAIAVLGTMGAAKAIAECDYESTPLQPLGPFYPKKFPLDTDVDLTQLKGKIQRAKGELVVVSGIVSDENCRPVKGAIVEIWQACETGRYNHPSDTSDNKLDPDFQYYGLARTNDKGEYSFKTIKPGSYLASPSWRRPPHIHYKVSLRGYKELVTQLYFAGDILNKEDQILQNLAASDQQKVVIEFKRESANGETALRGQFDLTLHALN